MGRGNNILGLAGVLYLTACTPNFDTLKNEVIRDNPNIQDAVDANYADGGDYDAGINSEKHLDANKDGCVLTYDESHVCDSLETKIIKNVGDESLTVTTLNDCGQITICPQEVVVLDKATADELISGSYGQGAAQFEEAADYDAGSITDTGTTDAGQGDAGCTSTPWHYDGDQDGKRTRDYIEGCEGVGFFSLPESAPIDCDDLNRDNNQDNLGQACTTGLGECLRSGNYVCSADGSSTACDAPIIPPGEKRCDGGDSDCDGNRDIDCCVDQCLVEGEESCVSFTTKDVCGNFNTDSCLESIIIDCPEDQSCIASSCTNFGSRTILGYWKLNGDALDSGPNELNGVNNRAIPTDSVFGNAGGALQFGSERYVSLGLPEELSLSSANSFSIFLWFRTAQLPTPYYPLFADEYTGNNTDMGIYIQSSGDLFFQLRAGSSMEVITSGQNYADGNWHHLAAVYNTTGHQASLYIDSINEGNQDTPVISGNIADGAINLGARIGTSTGIYYLGNMDEVIVFSGAVTAEGVQAYYDSHQPLLPP